MNKSEIVACLDIALAALDRFPRNSRWKRDNSIDLLTAVNKETPPIISILEKQPEFSGCAELMIYNGNGCSSLLPIFLASKLIYFALECGSEAAADWLHRAVNTQKADIECVALLWDVSVEKPFPIIDGINIVPYDQLRSSAVLQNFQENLFTSWLAVRPDLPKAALISSIVLDKIIYSSSELPEKLSNPAFERKQLLNEIALALSMVGPCAPMIAATWAEFIDEDLQYASLGGVGAPIHEVVPLWGVRPQYVLSEDVRPLLEAYFNFPLNQRNRLKIALERLNYAIRRRKPGDKAIEVSIALETLLLDNENGEIGHRLGLRAALMLATELESRRRIRSLIKACYELRSGMVHNGVAHEKYKVKGRGPLPSEEIAEEAIQYCAAIIREIVKLGCIPKWSDVELSGGLGEPSP